jgi:hypothetical protein
MHDRVRAWETVRMYVCARGGQPAKRRTCTAVHPRGTMYPVVAGFTVNPTATPKRRKKEKKDRYSRRSIQENIREKVRIPTNFCMNMGS